MTKKKVLVVEAHSDDSAISAAGFLKHLKKTGHEIEFYLAAVSEIQLHHTGLLSRKQRMLEYESFVKKIGGIWNIERHPPFDADGVLDTIPKAKVVSAIENVITDAEPDMMIVQGPSFHHDHTIVYEATIAATRPTARHIPERIYIMENPTYVHSLGPSTDFHPNFFFAMSEEETEEKLETFRRCFPSQIRSTGNYLSADGIKSWARYRGIEARTAYAEAFKIFRWLERGEV